MSLLGQMRQRVSWNVRLRTHHWPATLLCFILVTFFGFLSSIRADTPIYKYEDDSGTVTFTEQWDSIPNKYRGRVVTLNPQTLKPVEVGSTQHRAHASQPTTGEQSTDSMWNSWRDRLNGLSIPLPTQFQLGVGLTSGVLIVSMLMMRRYTSSPFTRILLKLVVVILLGGTVYALYFSSLNAELSSLTGEPLHQTITRDSLMQTVETTSTSISHAIQNGVVHPLQSVMEQSKDATLGKASRTVNQSNAATTQMENTLKETEIDQAHIGGQ